VVGSGAVHRADRDCRRGTVPSYYSKGYPCSRVPTVAPGPASGEGTSLQVGPKLDRRLARHFRALADIITVSLPSVTSTATPVPAANWPVTSALDGFTGPRAGCLSTTALILKFHLLCLLRQPRGGAVLVRAAVRLLCTQEPAPKEDDSWAQALMPEIGLSASASAKRRTTAGGGALFTRWFAFSAHRNRRARCMTCGPGPPSQRLDRWLRRRRGGALPRGGSTLLVWWFAFVTVGRGEDEGAHYRGAVACSLCGGSPSSHLKTSAPAVRLVEPGPVS
jgi:hypothetical protein